MKQLNDNVIINYVDLNDWDYDENQDIFPKMYEVSCTFCGQTFISYFSTKNIRLYKDGWYLENCGCEGNGDLIDSMSDYFEDHENDAKILVEMMKDEWETNCRDDSPYNYLGIKEETK